MLFFLAETKPRTELTFVQGQWLSAPKLPSGFFSTKICSRQADLQIYILSESFLGVYTQHRQSKVFGSNSGFGSNSEISDV